MLLLDMEQAAFMQNLLWLWLQYTCCSDSFATGRRSDGGDPADPSKLGSGHSPVASGKTSGTGTALNEHISLVPARLQRLPLFQPSVFATKAVLARMHLLMAFLHWMASHQRLLAVLVVSCGAAGLAVRAFWGPELTLFAPSKLYQTGPMR